MYDDSCFIASTDDGSSSNYVAAYNTQGKEHIDKVNDKIRLLILLQ